MVGKKRRTSVSGQGRLPIESLFKLCDEIWDFVLIEKMQIVPFDIGTIKGSPRTHFDESVSAFSDEQGAKYWQIGTLPSGRAFVRYQELEDKQTHKHSPCQT